jgi:transcription initiation factor IIE alpha subunit
MEMETALTLRIVSGEELAERVLQRMPYGSSVTSNDLANWFNIKEARIRFALRLLRLKGLVEREHVGRHDYGPRPRTLWKRKG